MAVTSNHIMYIGRHGVMVKVFNRKIVPTQNHIISVLPHTLEEKLMSKHLEKNTPIICKKRKQSLFTSLTTFD